jgi:hypothetical protein
LPRYVRLQPGNFLNHHYIPPYAPYTGCRIGYYSVQVYASRRRLVSIEYPRTWYWLCCTATTLVHPNTGSFRKMELCRYCCNITLKRPSRYQLRCAAHQPSGEALQKSAHDGCPLCSKFWAALCDENEMAYDLHHPRHSDKEGIASDVYYDKSSSVMLQSRRNHYGGIRIICGRLVALIHSPGTFLVGVATHAVTLNLLTFVDTLNDLLSRAYVSPDGRWLPGLNILLSRPSVSPSVGGCPVRIISQTPPQT